MYYAVICRNKETNLNYIEAMFKAEHLAVDYVKEVFDIYCDICNYSIVNVESIFKKQGIL